MKDVGVGREKSERRSDAFPPFAFLQFDFHVQFCFRCRTPSQFSCFWGEITVNTTTQHSCRVLFFFDFFLKWRRYFLSVFVRFFSSSHFRPLSLSIFPFTSFKVWLEDGRRRIHAHSTVWVVLFKERQTIRHTPKTSKCPSKQRWRRLQESAKKKRLWSTLIEQRENVKSGNPRNTQQHHKTR